MDMTVNGLLRAYRTKQLVPQQVIEDIRQRNAEHSHRHIWIHLLSTSEIQPYLDNLQKFSPDELPLYGIPFAIKDNIDLEAIPTTAACAAFSYVPSQSAFVVRQLIDAGAIPIGKTNLDQFATGLVGTRSPWGACGNAFDASYISGGSSSGSAVAAALGLVSFALGTDTAGSGRVPAAFNNIIGVKPSKGLVSLRGVVPACRSLDCVSLFALTTDDANQIFEVMATYDDKDDYARPNPFTNNHRHYSGVPATFTFGVPRPEHLEFFGNDNAWHLFKKSIEKLEDLGGKRIEIDFSQFTQAARLLYEGPWVAERYAAIEKIMTEKPEALLPVIATIIGAAKNKTAVDAFKAQYQLQQYYQQAKQILAQVDFLVTPTTGTIYTIEEVNRDPITLNSQLGYYTNFMNLLDCAAVAMPAGMLDNRLPWGITFIADKFSDRKLLSFANLWQQALKLPLGATSQALPVSRLQNTPVITHSSTIPVVVCGAHLDGLPLNWQLRERGATFAEKTFTAKHYRLYALAGGPPFRPGLVRDVENGVAIEVEVWQVPASEFGSFVAGIPAPLGIGKVELADGRWLPGFICEPCGTAGAEEISVFGGWRLYMARRPT